MTETDNENLIKDFMRTKGYRVAAQVINGGDLAHDFIFAHESLVSEDSTNITGEGSKDKLFGLL
jgi:hypothetical protein